MSTSKAFSMTPKIRDFHDFSTFLESCREASGRLLGHLGRVFEDSRVPVNAFTTPKNGREKSKKIEKFSMNMPQILLFLNIFAVFSITYIEYEIEN